MFDQVLETVLAQLPAHLHELLEEVPLVVEDYPSEAVLRDLHVDDDGSGLCGLHWGIALTYRSVQHSGTLPDQMMIFREPIMNLSGYRSGQRGRGRGRRWGRESSDSEPMRELEHQIRVTVLHEIGHHFGLDEDDLRALGYG